MKQQNLFTVHLFFGYMVTLMNTLVNNHSTRWAPSLRIAFIEWIRLIGLIALFLISLNVQAQAEEIIFYHYDSTNSPVAATDMNGNVVWQERREPFGAPKLNQPEKQNHSVDYTGHVYDKRLGLMYMGRRFYDPKIGRFISADPIGFTPSNVQSFNRYAYANNNPYKYYDPDGREIRMVAHPVKLGFDHASIMIIPDNQALYANNRYFQNQVSKDDPRRFATIGAGPGITSDFGLGILKLQAGINRKSDVKNKKTDGSRIVLNGRNEDEVISSLFSNHSNYTNNLNYGLFPSIFSFYNSNSYAAGLINSVGLSAPQMTKSTLPGYSKPVPYENFFVGPPQRDGTY